MRSPANLRLYLVTDAGRATADLLERVAAAARGGVTLVQLRDKRASDGEVAELARLLQAVLAPFAVPLVVNDRVEVAKAVGAAGVHLGQSDMAPARARAMLGPEPWIGLSIEHVAEIEAVDPGVVDHVAASPVFATSTKSDIALPLGLEGVRALVSRTLLPVIGIGGIDASNAAAVIEAGAAGVAVVSAILAAADPERAARDLCRTVDNVLIAGRPRGPDPGAFAKRPDSRP